MSRREPVLTCPVYVAARVTSRGRNEENEATSGDSDTEATGSAFFVFELIRCTNKTLKCVVIC